MNIVFFILVSIAFLVTAWRQIQWVAPKETVSSPMQELGLGMIDAAACSVTLALGLAGVMALLRPLSGSEAYGILAPIIQDPYIGPDRYTGYLVSTL